MTAPPIGAGDLTERLTIQTTTPVAVAVTSITRITTTATVTTAAAHGFSDGDFVTHAGATPAAYNGEVAIDVTGPTTYTFQVAGNPATPPTGTITATFTSDNTGGTGSGWYTLATVWGSMRPLSARELLAAQAVNSTQTYEGTIYYRVPQDITPKMRVSWTPYGYAAAKVLEIHGVGPHTDEPRRFLTLDIGEVVAA